MATRVVVSCSSCTKELPLLPAFSAGGEFRLWHGSVCTSCARVYCSECLPTAGSPPCPSCGRPTEPAQLDALRRAGVID